MDKCYGCGKVALAYPVVAIMNQDDVQDDAPIVGGVVSEKGFVAVVVCADCHKDPAHRRAHAIKAHFVARENAVAGVMQAGSENLGG